MVAPALKWLLVALGGLLALALVALAAVPWLVDTPRLRAYVAHAAGQAVGRPVRLGSMSVSAFPLPAVRIRDVTIAEDPRFGTGAFLTVERGRIAIRLWPLFLGRVELADVALEGFQLSVVEDAGQWNLGTLGVVGAGRGAPRGASPPPSGGAGAATATFGRVRLVDGAVQYRRRDAEAPGLRLEAVRLELAPGPRPDTLLVVGEAEGRPGPIRFRVLDGALTLPASRQVSDAVVRASIQVDAPDLRPLAAGLLAPAELTGALGGTLRLRGTLGKLTGDGQLQAARVVLAQTQTRCGRPQRRELPLEHLRVPVAFAPSGLDVARAETRAAGGTVSVRVGLRLSPTAQATLSGIEVRAVQLEPILAGYACQPYAVAGALDLTGEAVLTPSDPWRTLSGQGQFRVGRGRLLGAGMLDLLRQAEALERTARGGRLSTPPGAPRLPAAFDAIAATYRIGGGMLSSHDLEYASGALRATAVGAYRLDDGWLDAAVTFAQGPTRVRARIAGAPGAVAITPIGVMRGEASLPSARLDRTAR